MTQYLLSVYQPDGAAPPPDVLEPIMKGIAAWEAELKEAGAWVFTAGLYAAETATVLRPRDNGVLTTDGPFAEGKEHVGGFTVIRAEDLDEALARGRQIAEITGLPIEVRPVRGD